MAGRNQPRNTVCRGCIGQMNDNEKKDMVVLVADNNMEHAIKGILGRHRSLGIRTVNYDVFRHPEHDPGCLLRGHLFLQSINAVNEYQHALVMLDHDGSGRERISAHELEIEIENNLRNNGWRDRAAAIVIEPELEVWAWSDSPHVDTILGWGARSPSLRTVLRQEDFYRENAVKPEKPKEAFEYALRIAGKPRSSALYRHIAEKVSLDRCVDTSFTKLRTTLQTWFPD